MTIEVTFYESEAVFACGALEELVKEIRKFLRETDHKYGSHNNVHRECIAHYRSAHATLLQALRAVEYPMMNRDIEDDPIDKEL
jgi:hypothetical protein